jgi:hypothetical protein
LRKNDGANRRRYKVCWEFPHVPLEADLFDGLVSSYREGDCRVDPVRFVRALTDVRREMYDFLDDDRPRRRAPDAA